MAAKSCQIMLWQQALAARELATVRRFARKGIRDLRELDRNFRAYWPRRNKGDTRKCSLFLEWRIDDYRRAKLHFRPDAARVAVKSNYAAE